MKKLGFLLFAIMAFVSCEEEVIKVDMSVLGVEKLEGNSGETEFLFTIQLAAVSTADVTFSYATRDENATAGEDYVATSGTATIPMGELTTTIPVTVLGDNTWEQEETFIFEIFDADNANITTAITRGEIMNEDKSGTMASDGYITPDSQSGMTLVWSDEFNGTAVNEDDWTYEVGASGWGNEELQDYQAGTNNAVVANGKLTITAKEESPDYYTSARMITKDKQEFKYGRIDIRAKLPEGQGIWPALWMLGHDIDDVSWPACGEIDIMELVGHQPSVTHGTIHWLPATGSHKYQGGFRVLPSGKFSDEFHVFTILWTSRYIRWYLDEVEFHRENVFAGDMTEFRHEHFFIFNIAVGGRWPGSPDATTVFPQTMEVDYIRVFQ